MALTDVSYGDDAPQFVNVIIEIPAGCGNKYEFRPDLGIFVLDRVQPTNLTMPINYGEVPQTLSEDGDPIDAMIITGEPLFQGAVVSAQVIGVMYMVDSGEKDEKLICVPRDDMHQEHIGDLKDINPHLLKKIEHYFLHYKDLQNKKVEITGWGKAAKAHKIVKETIKRFNESKK